MPERGRPVSGGSGAAPWGGGVPGEKAEGPGPLDWLPAVSTDPDSSTWPSGSLRAHTASARRRAREARRAARASSATGAQPLTRPQPRPTRTGGGRARSDAAPPSTSRRSTSGTGPATTGPDRSRGEVGGASRERESSGRGSSPKGSGSLLPVLLIIILVVVSIAIGVVADRLYQHLSQPGETGPSAGVSSAMTALPTGWAEGLGDLGAARASGSLASASPEPEPYEQLTTSADGMVRSAATGDGTWDSPAVVGEPTAGAEEHAYYLRVEGGTGVDADSVAATANRVLNDPRGWPAIHGAGFVQVDDVEEADFVLSIATPPTTDAMCAPLETQGLWSCNVGDDVVLNSDRWSHLVPWIPDAEVYHGYLVNHEVGHWLGHGHLSCAGPGLKAPLMMQQSKGLGECAANPWPTEDGLPA